jgi:hypothetical protein
MSNTRQTLNFLQRRILALETDIEDITAMYLNAVSTKNMQLAEQCEITLGSARQHQYEIIQSLKAFQSLVCAAQRPVRKPFNN